MIGRLTGRILECRPERVVLDVGGVGYLIRVPLGTYYALARASSSTVSLHVHTYVREEALQLYGFSAPEERAVFEQLISITGVGPRIALALLSGVGVDELRECVLRRDGARLQKIPGVGKKTAERLMLELRDRFGPAEAPREGASAAEEGPEEGRDERSDAVSALVNLGYAASAARRAVEASLAKAGGRIGLEALLRAALGRLSR